MFENLFKKYPNVTQKLILKAGDKVLVFQYENGAYGFPGGRLEWKEDLFQGLKREMKEELNYDLVEFPRLFNVWNFMEKNRHSVKINYILEIPTVIDLVSQEGHRKVLWMTQKQLSTVFKTPEFVERIFSWRDPGTPHSMNYAD